MNNFLKNLANLIYFVIIELKEEYKTILNMAIPSYFTSLIESFQYTLDIIIIGQLNGNVYIGAIGLSMCFGGLTVSSFIQGLCTALETLCSQSYGAKNYSLYGRLLNRGIFCITTIMLFPLLITSYFSQDILIFLGFDSVLSYYASKYTIYQIPFVIMMIQFEILRRYLVCQRETRIQLIAIIISTIIHIILSFILVYLFKLHVIGIAISHCISMAISLITLIYFIKAKSKYKNTWLPISKTDLQGWGQILEVGIPGLAMILPEAWGYSMTTFFSGYFGPIQISASYSIIQVDSLIGPIYWSIGEALCALGGNSIGSKNKVQMVRYLKASLLLFSFVTLLFQIFLISFNKIIPLAFTRVEEIDNVISNLLHLLIFTIACEGLQCIMGFMLKAMGMQKVASIGNITAFLIVEYSLGLGLSFGTNLKMYGLWIGYTAASLCSFIFYSYIYLTSDWKKIFKKVDDEIAVKREF